MLGRVRSSFLKTLLLLLCRACQGSRADEKDILEPANQVFQQSLKYL